MARKNRKKKAQEEVVSFQQQAPVRPMPPQMGGMPGCPYPVAPPARIVQLPPIVQPIVMVPFTSQQQPIASINNDDDDDDFDF